MRIDIKQMHDQDLVKRYGGTTILWTEHGLFIDQRNARVPLETQPTVPRAKPPVRNKDSSIF